MVKNLILVENCLFFGVYVCMYFRVVEGGVGVGNIGVVYGKVVYGQVGYQGHIWIV